MPNPVLIKGFPVVLDRAYDLDTHMWAKERDEGTVRIGMDTLGLETSGTLAQLLFAEVGTSVVRNEPVGSLEAEKFVGPIVSPLSGRVVAVNDAALVNPSVVQDDPYGQGWLIELDPTDFVAEQAELTTGDEAIAEGFTSRIEEYRREGVLAE